MVDCLNKYLAGFIQIAASIEQGIHLGPILGPFLDLVEIEFVGVERIIGLVGEFGALRAVYRNSTIHLIEPCKTRG